MNALLLSAILGVVMMFAGIVLKDNRHIRVLATAGLLLLLGVNVLEMGGTRLFHVNTRGLLAFDRFALLMNAIVFAGTFLYVLISARDIERVGKYYADYFALIFFILCGVALVTSFRSLLLLFLGIEIISIPLYILTGSDKRNLKSNEAALKYFLLGSFSTGLLLMGIALVYGARGSFDAAVIGSAIQTPSPALLMAGVLLLLFAMAFKVSAAPFHFWTPDVYDGAPTVFTSFMASLVKVALFAGFLRLFDHSFGESSGQWRLFVSVLVALTLLIGNITAVFQQSVKRMLAYSSISQAGFMLLAVFAMNSDAREGLLLYAAAYCLATIGIFAVLSRMDDYTFEGFNGLARREPLLAAATTIFLLSLAGIPLTAGFLAKFYMLKAALAAGMSLWLVIFAVLMAAVSLYYYFRVIQAMYFREGNGSSVEASGGFRGILLLLAGLVILLGLFPQALLAWFYF